MKPLAKATLWVSAVTVAACMLGCGGGSGTAGGSGGITGRVVPSGGSAGQAAETFTFSVDGQHYEVTPALDGSFKVNGVPAGLHTLTVHSPDHAVAVVAQVVSGGTTDVGDIVPRDAGQISGLITQVDSHAPIAGALVMVTEVVLTNTTDVMPHPVRVAKTSASGSYTVDALPVGAYVVNVSKIGFNSASLQVTVASGATTPADLALSAAPTIGVGSMSGTVYLVTDSGSQTPLAGALVRLARQGDPQPMAPAAMNVMTGGMATIDASKASRNPVALPELYTFTDQNGAYALEDIPAGQYTAVAVRPGLDPDTASVTIVAGGAITHNFLLQVHQPQVGTITGTVADAVTNKPITGARVTVLFLPVPQPLASGGGSATGGSGTVADTGIYIVPGPYDFSAITDGSGAFKLMAPAGDRMLAVYADGYTPKNVSVMVKTGATVDVSVTLNPSPATGFTISGHVFQADGKTPVSGATVYFGGPVWPDPRIMAPVMLHTATTDSAGAYSTHLPAGKYGVSAYNGSESSALQYVDLTQNTTLDLVLTATATVPPPPPPKG